MTKWNMPPIAKVYEALSAVADGRVRLTSDVTAEVLSSERDKAYTVKWGSLSEAADGASEGHSITSNDNATRWQGYVGYPIIAVLLQIGRLPYDATTAAALAGAPWHALNQQYKRDYDVAVEHVLAEVRQRGGDDDAIRRDVARIYAALAELGLERPEPKRSSGKQAKRTFPEGDA